MQYPVALITFLVFVALPGCGSKTKLPPVSPEDVEVFMAGQKLPPEGSYVVVWQTSDYRTSDSQTDYDTSYNQYPGDWTVERIVEHLRRQAAKNGADALLIDFIGKPGISLSSMRRTAARAICFLHRHPELAEKK